MKTYKYEIHTHTSQVSRCSVISGSELARLYKNLGCSAFCVTDHFYNGNTTVPENLNWEKRVELFCIGYEDALNEGDKIGIKVFFGWEYSWMGSDFLTFGLDKNWLLKNENCLDLSLKEYCALVRDSGGYIVHAHPFRKAWYIDMIRLCPDDVDGVEVYNANRLPEENERALWYADQYNLKSLCGSDIHSANQKSFGFLVSGLYHETIKSLIGDMKSGSMQIKQFNV